MTQDIPVEIMPDGMAKEVNRLRVPNPKDYDANFGGIHYRRDLAKWKKAESNRRMFKIVYPDTIKDGEGNIFETVIIRTFTNIEIYQIGTTHTAECNLENMTCIIL